MHVTIDGFGGNPERLGDLGLVRSLLDRCPDAIGMTKISEPQCLEHRGPKPEDWGVSGFVMIAESHIAIHTFPERGQVWADVFSCKGFDAAPAIELFVETFELSRTRVHTLERGLEHQAGRLDQRSDSHAR